MTFYEKCLICNSQKSKNKCAYCSTRCRNLAIKRLDIVFEHRDQIFNDIAKMCPIHYFDAIKKTADKYYLSTRIVGKLFKKLILISFKCYPKNTMNNPIIYLPGQEDKASEIYRETIKKYDEATLSAISKRKKLSKEKTPIVLEMWEMNKRIPEIQKETKLSVACIKKIITEGGRGIFD